MKSLPRLLLGAALMLVTLVAAEAKEVTIGKLKYKVNTTEKIAKCTGLATEATKNYNLTIPSTVTYDGVTLKVTTVEKEAFWWDEYLKKVTLSDYTETIGTRAFANCENMSVVSLGKKLKIIGTEAFAHSGLNGTFTSVKFPSTLEIIRTDAFQDCRYLATVEFNDKLLEIGDYAFWNCEALKSVLLPGSLNRIGVSAFAECASLHEVTFKNGNGQTVIGEKCFDNVKSLKLVSFYGPGVAEIGPSAFIGCNIEWLALPTSVHTIGGGAFCGNNLTLLELPEGLKNIGELAFYDQYGPGLSILTIPSTVTFIGQKAFGLIGKPSEVRCTALVPPAAEPEAFSTNVLDFSNLVVPPSTVARYRGAAVWCDFRYLNNQDTLDGIETVTAPEESDADDDDWFDLQGRRLPGRPTAPGVYIHSSRRVYISR